MSCICNEGFSPFYPNFTQANGLPSAGAWEKIVPYLIHSVLIISPGLGLRLPFYVRACSCSWQFRPQLAPGSSLFFPHTIWVRLGLGQQSDQPILVPVLIGYGPSKPIKWSMITLNCWMKMAKSGSLILCFFLFGAC